LVIVFSSSFSQLLLLISDLKQESELMLLLKVSLFIDSQELQLTNYTDSSYELWESFSSEFCNFGFNSMAYLNNLSLSFNEYFLFLDG